MKVTHIDCVGYCRKCFEQLELLLVAVAESTDSQHATRVILNPSGAGGKQSAVKISKNMKGFFVCQSEDDAKRVQYYCHNCHGNVTRGSTISKCPCYSDEGECSDLTAQHWLLTINCSQLDKK